MPRPPVTFLKEQLAELEHLELRPPSDFYTQNFQSVLDRWFGTDRWRKKGTRFTLVATDASGGMYCMWWYPDLGEKRAPIVYLGSEGNGLSVIANGTVELVEAICTGSHWQPGAGYVTETDVVDSAKLAVFADRARAEFGFAGRTAAAIGEEGRANHPDFEAWVKKNTG